MQMTKQSDPTYLEGLRRGDEAVLGEMVRINQDRIYNLCRYLLKNPHDAEDAAQDVFLKACRKAGELRPDSSISAWLCRIAVNTCADYRKRPFFESLFRWGTDGDELEIDPPCSGPTPEQACENSQVAAAIERTLRRMSEKLRTVLVLNRIEGLSYEEIALVLDVSLGTVKSRISRAREEFMEAMGEYRE